MRKAFTVRDRFAVGNDHIILIGSAENPDLLFRKHDIAMIRQVWRADLMVVVESFELIRPRWSTRKPVNMCLRINEPIDIALFEVGAEVWSLYPQQS